MLFMKWVPMALYGLITPVNFDAQHSAPAQMCPRPICGLVKYDFFIWPIFYFRPWAMGPGHDKGPLKGPGLKSGFFDGPKIRDFATFPKVPKTNRPLRAVYELRIPASALTRRDGQDLWIGSGLTVSMCRDRLPATWIPNPGFPDFGGCPKSWIFDGPKIRDFHNFPKASLWNRPLQPPNGIIFRSRFARAPSGPVFLCGLAHNPPYLSKSDLGQIPDFGPWAL